MDKETLANNLRSLMQRHDWYYDRSDDYGVYRAGKRAYEAITYAFADLDKIDPSFAREVWNEKAPAGRKFV